MQLYKGFISNNKSRNEVDFREYEVLYSTFIYFCFEVLGLDNDIVSDDNYLIKRLQPVNSAWT